MDRCIDVGDERFTPDEVSRNLTALDEKGEIQVIERVQGPQEHGIMWTKREIRHSANSRKKKKAGKYPPLKC